MAFKGAIFFTLNKQQNSLCKCSCVTGFIFKIITWPPILIILQINCKSHYWTLDWKGKCPQNHCQSHSAFSPIGLYAFLNTTGPKQKVLQVYLSLLWYSSFKCRTKAHSLTCKKKARAVNIALLVYIHVTANSRWELKTYLSSLYTIYIIEHLEIQYLQ